MLKRLLILILVVLISINRVYAIDLDSLPGSYSKSTKSTPPVNNTNDYNKKKQNQVKTKKIEKSNSKTNSNFFSLGKKDKEKKKKENTSNAYVDYSNKSMWSIYFLALYPSTDRVIIETNKQLKYKPKLYYGVGLSRDNLRVEYSQYLEKPRFIAAYDFFPRQIATPYVGYIYSRVDRKVKNNNTLFTKSDYLLGVSFQPINNINFYGEYLVQDHYFFIGARLKFSIFR